MFIDEPKSNELFPAMTISGSQPICPDLVGGVGIRAFANAIGPLMCSPIPPGMFIIKHSTAKKNVQKKKVYAYNVL